MGTDDVLDRAAFDDFAGLFHRDELRGVIEEWHADSEKALAAIADARSRDDRAQIGELAHRAAGGAMAIGASAMARACEQLRAAAESGAAVDDAAVARVRAAVQATYAAMTDAVTDGA
jgi:HPt (histidine-containing phosphotransfer) domain-containing protein